MAVADGVAAAAGLTAWQLLVTSATPTLIVCILAAVGATLAHKVWRRAEGGSAGCIPQCSSALTRECQ
jgi:hypothetical protein